ncbi:tetratricopeptide repeat protein [bacterium]|nr:tetratricopeptide repeat protein [bacterium]
MRQDLIKFADCLSEAFSSRRVSPLNNFSLRTYLPLLSLENLINLYESIQQASNSQRRRLSPEIPHVVANEIVFRTLVKIPRSFATLNQFLASYFPYDRLSDSISRILPFESPPFYPRLRDLLDFDLNYLDALKNLLEIPTQFSDAIQKVLSRFANETYSVNLLFAVDKDFSDYEISPETEKIITEHFLDGLVRQVVTDRQPAWAGIIFDESSQVGKLFVDTARRAQEAMRDYLGTIDFYRYQFVDDFSTPLFFHEGSSGGLAFSELYYLAHTELRSPLAPYTAFVGALNEKLQVETVASILAKIQAAKENGIRILILPDGNQEELTSYEEASGSIQLISYREGVCSDVFSQIESLRKENGFLPENNLPKRHNRFIGREHESLEIRELLKKERLVNLIGTGGVGKTRLAEEVAFELLPSFPDGVWFVDFSSLRDANLVLPTIASALSIQPQPSTPLEGQMIDFLRTKRLLLVLDNFEQLPHKAGELIEELVQNTEFFRCLVTSRDVSTCPDGKKFLVAPLETPPPEITLTVDSVKLFLARAEELGQPLSEENLPTVAELCRMLDGIPLALELAAARLVDLSPEEILSRIKEQLPLQVAEPADTFDPRHRKLMSVLSWSYDLLTEAEQELFAQLSVFSGGFFTEAVEKICSGKHVLGNLFSLRAKSLVQTETAQQKKRYFLLSPVQQYAAEKLDDGTKIKKAHAFYFCIWVKEQDDKLNGGQQSQALVEMALELDNLRAAMAFAFDLGESKLLGEFGVALSQFFHTRGFWSEGIQCLSRAEEVLRALGANALFAKALNWLGVFYDSQGDYETAQNLYDESLQIRRELGDKQGIADALSNLGIIVAYQGKYDEAKRFHNESLQIDRDLGHKQGIAITLESLGTITARQGAYNDAKELYTESLKIKRELGDKHGIASTLNNLGCIALDQGAYSEAKQPLTESLKIARELGVKLLISALLNNLGIIACQQGAYDEARQILTESLKIKRELGDKSGIAESFYQFGKLAKAEGESAQAVLFLLAAARLYDEMQATNSTEAGEVDEALASIQKEMGLEQFEKVKKRADAMSNDEIVGIALSFM